MTRSYAFNLHINPVRTEMTDTQQIPISHVFSSDESQPEGIIAEEKLLQVCSTDKIKPEIVIVNESSTKGSGSESIHKSINTNEKNIYN